MRNQEDYKCRNNHLPELRPRGQPKEKTGRPGQDEEERQDPHDHTGDTVQEDPDPLDQRQDACHRKKNDFHDPHTSQPKNCR